LRLLSDSFKKSPRCFILQSLLATAAMAIILYFVKYLTQAAVVAALGASTFLAFAVPHGTTARPKKMLAGYFIGIVSGVGVSFLVGALPSSTLPGSGDFIPLTAGAVAVGLSIFLMTATASEHPPAAGVALSFAASGWTWETIGFILLFAIILSVVKKLLNRFMINLF
jgi:CBS-domain-containing membrane protein